MLKDTEPARAGVRADRALHRHHGRWTHCLPPEIHILFGSEIPDGP